MMRPLELWLFVTVYAQKHTGWLDMIWLAPAIPKRIWFYWWGESIVVCVETLTLKNTENLIKEGFGWLVVIAGPDPNLIYEQLAAMDV